MSIVRYNPNNNPMTSERNNFFDTMFDDFFAPFAMVNNNAAQHQFGPKVDIYEKDSKIYIDAEIPGVDKDAISVDVKGKILTLSGEAKSESEVEEKNLYRRERRFGSFARSFTLPFDVKSENVKATYNNGLLKLEIEKPEKEVATKVAIS